MKQGGGGGRGVRSAGVGHSGPAGVKPSGEYRMLNVEFIFLKRMAAHDKIEQHYLLVGGGYGHSGPGTEPSGGVPLF